MSLDVIEFCRDLVRCPSVTPDEGGALDLLQRTLEGLGFNCQRLPFEEPGYPPVDNLYARLGTKAPVFCYAGHTDVVPVGDRAAWSVDPFAAEVVGENLIGRGTVDMKGSIAAFVAATADYLDRQGGVPKGSIAFLITGDEEAEAVNGTVKMLSWLAEHGEQLDHCLVGEPTSDQKLGDMVKIGRRGSLNGKLVVRGIQGHTAYPQLADNPAHHLVAMLANLTTDALDDGSAHFPPSSLQVTTIDIGNPATNVIPAVARAGFNVRFNDLYSGITVEQWIRERLNRVGRPYELEISVSGESFLTPPGSLSTLVSNAVQAELGAAPELGTTGGTSDARFIKDACPVVEFGLRNATAHKVDEQVPLAELQALTNIYRRILEGYFTS
ncbi:succinyl-diaminopimelate desuccinylase [Limibacillus sp. MBR-115]|jgi:succinyl-diaminopimelate desuccinylase|uniref:succinyl-diaminopimelate desuccinylase n=1 Tax=Limibacillus sp. MBR-115 TaxID=3156465 RepID=UPI003396EE6A